MGAALKLDLKSERERQANKLSQLFTSREGPSHRWRNCTQASGFGQRWAWKISSVRGNGDAIVNAEEYLEGYSLGKGVTFFGSWK